MVCPELRSPLRRAGDGVAKDHEKGSERLTKAAAQGNPGAKQLMLDLERKQDAEKKQAGGRDTSDGSGSSSDSKGKGGAPAVAPLRRSEASRGERHSVGSRISGAAVPRAARATERPKEHVSICVTGLVCLLFLSCASYVLRGSLSGRARL